MAKAIPRDFSKRSQDDQQAFLQQTWCNTCMEMDLGMTEPQEYELEGRIYVEGKCVKCGSSVITEIEEDFE
ncbi:hypothetical protein [Balneatrix alpica]|uniref:Uncharacterized protein n=1 Tax=Balneatrix alpica TaxID=75684 RepID=A0ABV5Z8L2_9GAMM|nr:hypothetical protein [Balneatrix alpica]